MKQGRGSRRLAAVQREPIEPHVQRPPPDMEIAEFNARPGRLLKLFYNRSPRPEIRESAGNDIGERKRNGHHCRGNQCHPVLQAESSLHLAHLRTKILTSITPSPWASSLRSSGAILFPPAILWPAP